MSVVKTCLNVTGSLHEPGTIIQITITPRQTYWKTEPLIHLAYDILELIIAQVFLSHQDDLFTICTLSKHLYLACIPWIYRRITIDFSSPAQSTLLLQRLARNTSELSVFVRDVSLKNSGLTHKDSQDWILFDKCLSRFTNLLSLSCDNATSLPTSVLYSIHKFHPRTTIQAGISWTATIDYWSPHNSFFSSVALSQLTTFEFSASSDACLYTSFKLDLLRLLSKASSLAHLCIYQGPVQTNSFKVFPEMVSVFQSNRLPQLVSFLVITRSVIFTRNELEAWGVQKGWSRLRYLRLYRAYNLIPFISRAPELTFLGVTKAEGMDELEQYLQTHTNARLGNVQTLYYNHYTDNPFDTTDVMPWAIIKMVSTTLTRYTCWHQPLEAFDPGYNAPTVTDLLRLMKECPQVTHLDIDVRLCGGFWPTDILEQLAAFHNVKVLSLYVHKPTEYSRTLTGPIGHASDPNFEGVFKILSTTPSGFVSNPQFRVNFTEVQDFKTRRLDGYNYDWTFSTDSTGHIHSAPGRSKPKKDQTEDLKRDISKWSLLQLQDWLATFRSQYPQNWVDLDIAEQGRCSMIEREITRRTLDAKLKGVYGNKSYTLYDRLIKLEAVHEGGSPA